MTNLTKRLTAVEADYLAECEDRIERGLQTFVEVGTALAMIRDNKLYRADHPTFAEYCEARWSIGRAHAYRMIDAAQAVSPIGDAGLPLPANEAQARELARVPEAERVEVWTKANESTGGKPTAAAIREAFQPSHPETPARRDPEQIPPGTSAVATTGGPAEDRSPGPASEADGQLEAPAQDGVTEADGVAAPEAADSSVEVSGDTSTDGEEGARVPVSRPEPSDAAGAPAHFPAAGAPDPKTAAEPDIASADAAHSDVGLGTDAQRPGSDVAGGVAAPAPAVLSSAGAGVNPSDLVTKVLDALVPDDNPHREWQRRFLSDIGSVHRLMRNDVEDVAEKADSQCIEELGRIFSQLDEYRSKVLAALKASTPDNVTPLRRSS